MLLADIVFNGETRNSKEHQSIDAAFLDLEIHMEKSKLIY